MKGNRIELRLLTSHSESPYYENPTSQPSRILFYLVTHAVNIGKIDPGSLKVFGSTINGLGEFRCLEEGQKQNYWYLVPDLNQHAGGFIGVKF